MNKQPTQFRMAVHDNDGHHLYGGAVPKFIRLHPNLLPTGPVPGTYQLVEETAGSYTPLYRYTETKS